MKLGAVKARLGAQADKVDFLQAVGLLPDDLYVVSVETDVRRGVEKIVRIFEEFDVPEAARTAIADALAPAT